MLVWAYYTPVPKAMQVSTVFLQTNPRYILISASGCGILMKTPLNLTKESLADDLKIGKTSERKS